MRDHYFIVDNMAEREHAEKLRKEIVRLYIILLLHFTLESVHLIQLLGFMVSSTHEEVLRETDFPSKHCNDYFN